jgi:hypothetical protein
VDSSTTEAAIAASNRYLKFRIFIEINKIDLNNFFGE